MLDAWDTVSEIAHRVVFDVSESALGPAHDWVINQRNAVIRCCIRRKDFMTAEIQLRTCVKDLEVRKVRDKTLLPCFLYDLTQTLWKSQRFADAEDLALRLVRWTDNRSAGDERKTLVVRVCSFWYMYKAQKKQGFLDLAEASKEEAHNLVDTQSRPAHHLSRKGLRRLRKLVGYCAQTSGRDKQR